MHKRNLVAWFVIYVIVHGLYVGIKVSFIIRKLYVKFVIMCSLDGFDYVQNCEYYFDYLIIYL